MWLKWSNARDKLVQLVQSEGKTICRLKSRSKGMLNRPNKLNFWDHIFRWFQLECLGNEVGFHQLSPSCVPVRWSLVWKGWKIKWPTNQQKWRKLTKEGLGESPFLVWKPGLHRWGLAVSRIANIIFLEMEGDRHLHKEVPFTFLRDDRQTDGIFLRSLQKQTIFCVYCEKVAAKMKCVLGTWMRRTQS